MMPTFRIMNATSCIVELRSSTDRVSRISNEIVVMNSGVLLAAIWRTASLAVEPKFPGGSSLRGVVARLSSALKTSIASTYCCHI